MRGAVSDEAIFVRKRDCFTTLAMTDALLPLQDEVNRENALRDVEARIADIERSFDTKFHELDFARKLYLY